MSTAPNWNKMSETEIINKMISLAKAKIDEAAARYMMPDLLDTSVRVSLRGKAIGKARTCYYKGEIEEQFLFMHKGAILQNPDLYWKTVVPHEVAHLVCDRISSKIGHGIPWQRACIDLGGNGRRTYNSKEFFIPRKRKDWVYVTERGETVLSTRRHNKLQKLGPSGYRLRFVRSGGYITHNDFCEMRESIV